MDLQLVGLLLPSSNTTMETDFWRMVPEDVTIHSARMMIERVTVSALEEMSRDALRAGKLLATAGVDVLIYGCTSGSLIKGVEWEKNLVSTLEEETGIPTVTTAGAVVEGLRSLGIERVGVATPYTDDINALEREFLEAYGFEVEKVSGLNIVDNHQIRAVSSERIGQLVKSVAGKTGGVFVSCTNLPVVPLINVLEEKLGLPIVSSNQASMWAGLKKLGHGGFEGYGRLLKEL
jgi:maleate isomerase